MATRTRLMMSAGVITLATLAGCGSAAGQNSADVPVAHFDGPVYSSVEELAAGADTVLSGVVTGLRSRLTESTLTGRPDRAGASSLPLALYDVRVDREMRGTAPDTILVTRIDQGKLRTAEQTMFTTGQEVVLFLRDSGHAYEGATVYSVVGMDQGKLTVSGGRVRAAISDEPAERRRSLGEGSTVEQIARRVK